ncbi:MAG: glycosyltransferase family 4 protein [Proteobacteria bacterium]|nr:glycosyltransferase family 4 protein [Pseudomonadota bacterium]
MTCRRIAILAPIYPAVSETFVYREAEGLRQRGFEVLPVSLYEIDAARKATDVPGPALTLLGPGAARTLGRAVVEIARHPVRSSLTLGRALCDVAWPGESLGARKRLLLWLQAWLALGLARWLRRQGVDHLHAHFANGPATVGMYAALQAGIPFSFVGHANDLFDRRTLLVRKLERAQFVSCISHWHRGWYREQVPGDDDRYPVIRCGVDPGAWSPRGVEPEAGRPFSVLAVARLIPKKGIDTLIRALARTLENDELDWRLVIAGDGYERAALEALVEALGVRRRVRFEGSVPNARVRELMAEADLLGLPCRTDALGDRDGVPVVLMEAMAAGLPVVVGDLPAVRELVEDGETGRVVAPDDVPALARVLVQLCENPAEARRLAAAGRRRVEDEFSAAPNIDRLAVALQRAGRPGGGRAAVDSVCSTVGGPA